MSKFIQITASSVQATEFLPGGTDLFALDDQGGVWFYDYGSGGLTEEHCLWRKLSEKTRIAP